jgi:hypothetical protein
VIVRIATEGQYELGEADVAGLNELDNAAVSACQGLDEAGFQEAFQRLLSYVRDHGQSLADERLDSSDVILPPPDISLAEAREEFTGEGLIPG